MSVIAHRPKATTDSPSNDNDPNQEQSPEEPEVILWAPPRRIFGTTDHSTADHSPELPKIVAIVSPVQNIGKSWWQQPTISVKLTIDTPIDLSDPAKIPKISLTATLHADHPITMYTWGNLFDLKLSQQRFNFTCFDLTADSPLRVETKKGGRRSGFVHREKGGPDEPHFHTLYPATPRTFTDDFDLAKRSINGLQADHRYRFGVREGEMVHQWLYGTKEEVMSPPGTVCGFGEASGGPIYIRVDPVDFEAI